MIREGDVARNVGRTEPLDAVEAGLERIAAPAAEPLRQPPVGAAAGSAKPATVSGEK